MCKAAGSWVLIRDPRSDARASEQLRSECWRDQSTVGIQGRDFRAEISAQDPRSKVTELLETRGELLELYLEVGARRRYLWRPGANPV